MIQAPLEDPVELAVLAAFQKLKPAEKQQFLCLRDNGIKMYPNMTNAFIDNNMTVSNIVKHRDGNYPARGMFILQPRFNHSCVPNCKAPFEGKETISTYAITDIAASEELTLCYDTTIEFYPMKARHAALGFVCDCRACLTGTAFQQLSEIRRTLIRGLMYLQDGEDVNRKRHCISCSIIVDPRLKRMAEEFKITLTSRFIYLLLMIFLLDEEGLLDSFTLKLLRRKLNTIVNLFHTERNVRIAHLAMKKKSWLRKFVVAFKLYGQEDGADIFASMYYRNKVSAQGIII